MPASDPMVSVGYLVAAGALTVVGLLGYGVALWRWLAEARARNADLKRRVVSERP